MTTPLAAAPPPAGEIGAPPGYAVNYMYNACIRAWHVMGRRLEAEHPGWSVRYCCMGFYAQRPGSDLLGPANFGGIEALMTVADSPAIPVLMHGRADDGR